MFLELFISESLKNLVFPINVYIKKVNIVFFFRENKLQSSKSVITIRNQNRRKKSKHSVPIIGTSTERSLLWQIIRCLICLSLTKAKLKQTMSVKKILTSINNRPELNCVLLASMHRIHHHLSVYL